jgi:hypothetical protein
MKNVNEIVELTRTAIARKQTEKHDHTMDCINTTISRGIERAANNGKFDTKFLADDTLDRDLIKRVLEAQGFEVTIKGFEVKVSWLSKFFEKGA